MISLRVFAQKESFFSREGLKALGFVLFFVFSEAGLGSQSQCQKALQTSPPSVLQIVEQLEGPKLEKAHQTKDLQRLKNYLEQVHWSDLKESRGQLRVSARIIEILYGDKFSLWKRLRLGSQRYQERKHELIIREFLLKQGLKDIAQTLVSEGPRGWARFRGLSYQIMEKMGLPWISERLLFEPLAYREIPPDLQATILNQGWDASRTEIRNYFRGQQNKRDVFNDWQRPLSMAFGAVLSIGTYFSVYDENQSHFMEFQKDFSSQLSDQQKLFSSQRRWVEQQKSFEDGLLRELEGQEPVPLVFDEEGESQVPPHIMGHGVRGDR